MYKTITTPKCPRCGKTSSFTITFEQYKNVVQGFMHMQDIFPGMSADDRETLISGYHSDCWDLDFAPLDDIEDWDGLS